MVYLSRFRQRQNLPEHLFDVRAVGAFMRDAVCPSPAT